MTAAVTLTRAEAPDEAVERAWDLLDRAESLPWPDEGYDAIADAAGALKNTLELCDDMLGLGWAQDAVLAELAEQVAEDIQPQADALVTVIGKHIGEDAAAYVGGGEGGEQQ
jgi:hypothetical protein